MAKKTGASGLPAYRDTQIPQPPWDGPGLPARRLRGEPPPKRTTPRMAAGKLQAARQKRGVYQDRVQRLERALGQARAELEAWKGKEQAAERELHQATAKG